MEAAGNRDEQLESQHTPGALCQQEPLGGCQLQNASESDGPFDPRFGHSSAAEREMGCSGGKRLWETELHKQHTPVHRVPRILCFQHHFPRQKWFLETVGQWPGMGGFVRMQALNTHTTPPLVDLATESKSRWPLEPLLSEVGAIRECAGPIWEFTEPPDARLETTL